jgi:hypothetical protein
LREKAMKSSCPLAARLVLSLPLVTLSCGGGSEAPTPAAGGSSSGGGVVLDGAVQKGPFVVGSSVQLSLLDAALQPTGAVFNTSTTNDLGEFQLSFSRSGPVSLEGQGFYYNEVTGALSQGNLTLRAFYVPGQAGAQSAYINMVTHLTYGRVQGLVAGGADFSQAVEQAEVELLGQLAITPSGFEPGKRGIDMNIVGGDDDANAYLLALSSVLAQAAFERDSSSADAELQLLLNSISVDLAEDGTLLAATADKVTAGLAALDADRVTAALEARLADVGSAATVPEMNRVLDQDRDGLANADDNCRTNANPEQEDADSDGHGDACDPCPETACPAACAAAAETGSSADFCYSPCDREQAACQESGAVCVSAPLQACEPGRDQGCQVAPLPCVKACDALVANECPSGQACTQVMPYSNEPQSHMAGDPDPRIWACLPVLSAAPVEAGGACEPEPGSCDAGLACASEAPWCAAEPCCATVCDLETGTPCAADVPCLPYDAARGIGVCSPLAGRGEACEPNFEGCLPELACVFEQETDRCLGDSAGCCVPRCTLGDGAECEAGEQCGDALDGGGVCRKMF